MKLYAYSHTAAGIQRRAQQRGLSAPAIEAPRKPSTPASPPVANVVLQFTIPRDTINGIIAAIAHQHSVSVGAIMSCSRKRKAVEARFDAIAAIKIARPCISLGQLSRIFGKDHTSIHNALRKRGLA